MLRRIWHFCESSFLISFLAGISTIVAALLGGHFLDLNSRAVELLFFVGISLMIYVPILDALMTRPKSETSEEAHVHKNHDYIPLEALADREQLIWLKKRTGIKSDTLLVGFCLSLAANADLDVFEVRELLDLHLGLQEIEDITRPQSYTRSH